MLRRVVLLGQGIGYSASPPIHNAAFAELGLPWCYELRDLPADELPAVLAELRRGELSGANVTQPHKAAVILLLEELTPAARRVGAVNTIVHREGRLVGDTTDLAGLAAEIADLGRFERAVVLGRGGAARTAAAALADAGTDARLVARDEWPKLPALLARADLLINATPIGTAEDVSPIPAGLLRPDLTVLDLVYRPSPTRLVREARAAGSPARAGGGLLLRQAALSFSAWTNLVPPIEAMRRALHSELGADADA